MLIVGNRITCGGAVRRAAALLAILALAGVALALAGCGGGSADGDETAAAEQEREADVETLNRVLGRQLAAIAAYDRVLPRLTGAARTLAQQFRQQEQEHVDGLLEALRGLGGEEEPAEEEIETGGMKGEAERLRFLYELEAATLEEELSAVGRLDSGSARLLLAATAANQAQHLVLLRRALGAVPLEWVPAPFETGDSSAP